MENQYAFKDCYFVAVSQCNDHSNGMLSVEPVATTIRHAPEGVCGFCVFISTNYYRHYKCLECGGYFCPFIYRLSPTSDLLLHQTTNGMFEQMDVIDPDDDCQCEIEVFEPQSGFQPLCEKDVARRKRTSRERRNVSCRGASINVNVLSRNGICVVSLDTNIFPWNSVKKGFLESLLHLLFVRCMNAGYDFTMISNLKTQHGVKYEKFFSQLITGSAVSEYRSVVVSHDLVITNAMIKSISLDFFKNYSVINYGRFPVKQAHIFVPQMLEYLPYIATGISLFYTFYPRTSTYDHNDSYFEQVYQNCCDMGRFVKNKFSKGYSFAYTSVKSGLAMNGIKAGMRWVQNKLCEIATSIRDKVVEFGGLVWNRLSDVRSILIAMFTALYEAFARFGSRLKDYLPFFSASLSQELQEGDEEIAACEEYEPQGLGDLVTDLTSFIFSVISAVIPERWSRPQDVCVQAGKFFSAVVVVERGGKFLIEKTKMVIDAISYYVSGDPFFNTSQLLYRVKKCKSELRRIHSVLLNYPPNECFPQEEIVLLNKYGDEAKQLYIEAASVELDNAHRLSLKQMIDSCNTVLRDCKLFLAQNAFKPRPVLVVLHGLPGRGKSEFAKALPGLVTDYIRAYCLKTGRSNPYEGVHGSRSRINIDTRREKRYFEGYKNQFAVVLEELYTGLGQENNQDWSARLMDWCNEYPVELEMAFEGKGATFMCSPLIICTTNHPAHVFSCVDPDAYLRRLDFDLVYDSVRTEGSHAVRNGFAHVTECQRNYLLSPRAVWGHHHFEKDELGKNTRFTAAHFISRIAMLVLERKDASYGDTISMDVYSELQQMLPQSLTSDIASLINSEVTLKEKLYDFMTRHFVPLKGDVDYHLQTYDDFCGSEYFEPYKSKKQGFYDVLSGYKSILFELSNFLSKDEVYEWFCVNRQFQYVHPDDVFTKDVSVVLSRASCVLHIIWMLCKGLPVHQKFLKCFVNGFPDSKRSSWFVDGSCFPASFIRVVALTVCQTSFDLVNFSQSCHDGALESRLIGVYEDVEDAPVDWTLTTTAVCSAVLVGLSAAVVASQVLQRVYPDYDVQSLDEKAPSFNKMTHVKKEIVKENQTCPVFVAQGGNTNPAMTKAAMNTYHVIHNDLAIGHCVFLGMNIAVFNRHVFEALSGTFYLRNLDAERSFRYARKNVKILWQPSDRDLTFVDLMTGSCHPHLHKFFLDDCYKEAPLVSDTAALFYTPVEQYSKVKDTNVLRSNWRAVDKVRTFSRRVPVRFSNENFESLSYLMVSNVHTSAGDCGSPYLVFHRNKDYCVGIHTLGSVNTGSAMVTPLYKSDWINCMNACDMEDAQIDMEIMDPQSGIYDITPDGIVSPVLTSPLNKSVFVKTPFADEANGFEFWPPPKKPAHLDMKAYEKACDKAVSYKHCASAHHSMVPILEEFGDHILNTDLTFGVKNYDMRDCRFLTLEEAMWGNDVIDGFDFSTANGMRLKQAGLDKSDLHPDVKDPDTLDFVRNYVHDFEKRADQGVFTYMVTAESLKDELRDNKRVDDWKTRIFYVTDFMDNVLIKMYVGDIVNRLKRVLGVSSHVCGITPGSGLWRYFYNLFLKYETVGSTDVSGYDFIGNHILLKYIIKWIWSMYPEATAGSRVRNKLAWAIISCVHALRFSFGKGKLYGTGVPSGCIITTFLGTIMHVLMMKSCFIKRAIKEGVDPLEALKNFHAIIYSDDNVFASPYSWWSSAEYARCMGKYYGVVVTATDKSQNFEDLHISKVEFLSRRFVPATYNKHVILAPLSIDSVLSQLFYVRKGQGKIQTYDFIMKQLEINIDNVIRELAHYSSCEAKKYHSAISDFVSRNRLPLNVPDLDFKTWEFSMLTC